jgi:hypothetical protein
MIPMQNNKKRGSIPASVATNATHTLVIDTLGSDQVTIDLNLGTATATTAASVLKLAEGATTSAFDDIPAYTGGTAVSSSVGFVIPARSATNVSDMVTFNVDMRGRKRYLELEVTPGAVTIMGAVANLGRLKESPTTAAGQGALLVVNG